MWNSFINRTNLMPRPRKHPAKAFCLFLLLYFGLLSLGWLNLVTLVSLGEDVKWLCRNKIPLKVMRSIPVRTVCVSVATSTAGLAGSRYLKYICDWVLGPVSPLNLFFFFFFSYENFLLKCPRDVKMTGHS